MVQTEPAAQNPTFYQENESEKVQESDSQSDYGYTTTVNYESFYDKVSDEQDASAAVSQSAEMPTARPGYGEDVSAVLEDHTMPANGYHDAEAPVAPQTSEFNKMPVMGIAYPVDMSYMEEEGNLPATAAGYGQMSSDSYEASTESTYQKLSTVQTEEPQPTYVRPTTNANKQNRPVASYIGMVTMQHYNPQPGNGDYQAQVPPKYPCPRTPPKSRSRWMRPRMAISNRRPLLAMFRHQLLFLRQHSGLSMTLSRVMLPRSDLSW